MLKLSKLPDRTPMKLTVTLSPDQHQRLLSYAALYQVTYGTAEPVADLIPYMLDAFLDSDRAYAKARKEELPAIEEHARQQGRRRADAEATHSTGDKET
ncbi:DUF2274 domain-containing protein [Niveispirillum irakense]|uniref:DUF2274 domain-containing protein n=1 Tax=Niveispirillum irakense TaxID=34011 RepID=UPI000415DADA|nr:DUF2274 domain-containing protein [Niveispirillum irakense]